MFGILCMMFLFGCVIAYIMANTNSLFINVVGLGIILTVLSYMIELLDSGVPL
jgi:hypothetical protein